ncbi:hypothetical protein BSF43_18740 [Pseudomonas ogarae]|uniref:hypothetical protein n=1 Tax=Pseudomonas ogarae (strain DSM 112162 / CECT 30235 / F113) TaxID=1114970 RepID=UPI0011449310|nr:hypothetical protein [Pseudomonas ogarae]PBJ12919.1 hypothetical protein BSF43_18740 [Pseudomonas ogarae]
MGNAESFIRALERANERRAKQQSKQHTKADGDVITNTTNGNVIATTKLTHEQYQATIILLMIAHIRQKKEKYND